MDVRLYRMAQATTCQSRHYKQYINKIEEAEDEHDVKYLVVRCLEGEVCGGFSDRMKGMPFYVMLANLTQRVLLIHWRKPCELEEFLVPPQNGLDWRVVRFIYMSTTITILISGYILQIVLSYSHIIYVFAYKKTNRRVHQ